MASLRAILVKWIFHPGLTSAECGWNVRKGKRCSCESISSAYTFTWISCFTCFACSFVIIRSFGGQDRVNIKKEKVQSLMTFAISYIQEWVQIMWHLKYYPFARCFVNNYNTFRPPCSWPCHSWTASLVYSSAICRLPFDWWHLQVTSSKCQEQFNCSYRSSRQVPLELPFYTKTSSLPLIWLSGWEWKNKWE